MVFSQDGVGLYLGQENRVRVLWGRFFKRNFSGFSQLLHFIWLCDLASIQGNILKRSLQPIGERRTSSDEGRMLFCPSKWYIEMMQASKWVFNTKTLLIVPDTVRKCEFYSLIDVFTDYAWKWINSWLHDLWPRGAPKACVHAHDTRKPHVHTC